MKTKGYKLYGCLLLVCAIGLAVSIATSLGNAKTPLSDEAMSNVFGGCGGGSTGPIKWTDESGCNTPTGTDHCDTRGVDPTTECTDWEYEQSCRRDESECENKGEGSCTDGTESCPTQVLKKECRITGDECYSPMGTGTRIDCDTTYSTYKSATEN